MSIIKWLKGEKPSTPVEPKPEVQAEAKESIVDPVIIEKAKEQLSVQDIILQIHNSYDSSAEKLLNEAKTIIEKAAGEDIEKGNRLAAIGFTGTAKAQNTERVRRQKEEALKLARLIEYYKSTYPFQKFITKEEVEQINNKYGLICVQAEYYNSDIPEKNLQEIETFKIVNKDDLVYSLTVDSGKGEETYHFVPRKDVTSRTKIETSWSRSYRVTHAEEPFYISCPPHEANIRRGYSVKKGSTFVTKDPIEDPIVLKPVVGGFLIVSKWGLEASDPLTINETLN